MAYILTKADIILLGFDWPRYPLIEEYCVQENGKINLSKTLEKTRSARAYYQKKLKDAYTFKMQTGADYSDFSNRYDDYASMERKLGEVVTSIEEIIRALEE